MTRCFAIVALCGAMLNGCAEIPSISSDLEHPPDRMPYSKSAYESGRVDAERDLRAGRLIVEIYGFPLRGEPEYAQMLRDRYGVELRRVASDIVDVNAIGHAMGYNVVSEAEIKRRFGSDVFERLQQEAERIYNQRQRPQH